MKVTRQQHTILLKTVAYWQQKGLLDERQRLRLMESIEQREVNWQGLARYAFFGALFCLLLSLNAMLLDKQLMALLNRLFSAPALVKAAFFALLAIVIFSVTLWLQKKNPLRLLTYESLFFLGTVSIASSIAFIGMALDSHNGHFSLLVLVAAVIYCCLGIYLPSKLVWLFGLLSLGAWVLAETGYLTGWNDCFYGMSYPLRFALFGGGLFVVSFWMQRRLKLMPFARITHITGLLFSFTGLWILSVIGNCGNLDGWYGTERFEFWPWVLALTIASIAAIITGLKYNDPVLRGCGFSFLFFNIYTRYVEYGWHTLHQAVFFGLLALSFWLLGRYAERIWLLGEKKQP